MVVVPRCALRWREGGFPSPVDLNLDAHYYNSCESRAGTWGRYLFRTAATLARDSRISRLARAATACPVFSDSTTKRVMSMWLASLGVELVGEAGGKSKMM